MPISLRPPAAAAFALGVSLGTSALGQTLESAHWRSTVQVEGAAPAAVLQRAEVWFQDGRIRVESPGEKGKSITIDAGGDLYVWAEGEKMGLRVNPALGASSGQPSHAYVRRTQEIRLGTLLRTETVDGHPCDVFEYAGSGEQKSTYWLARDLRFFPLKAVIRRSLVIALPFTGSRERKTPALLFHNTEVQVPSVAPAALFALPADVRFRDASEVLRPMRR